MGKILFSDLANGLASHLAGKSATNPLSLRAKRSNPSSGKKGSWIASLRSQ
jgi:hypothetical protein